MIALYRGTSFLSRAIQRRTLSEYSHAAWVLPDMSCVEAWSKGVTHTRRYDQDHNTGTVVDLFAVDLSQGEEDGLTEFLLGQVGKRYDWMGLLTFVTGRPMQNQEKWFCSELLFSGFQKIHKPLLARIPPWKVNPGMLILSPLLVDDGTLVCGQNERMQHEIDYVGDIGTARCF